MPVSYTHLDVYKRQVQTFYEIPVTLVNESYLANDMKIPLLMEEMCIRDR